MEETLNELLEKFLREPTLLTDDDVMELLTFIFQSAVVQKKLNLLIESRRAGAGWRGIEQRKAGRGDPAGGAQAGEGTGCHAEAQR